MKTSGEFVAVAKLFTRTNLPESEVELVGEIPAAEVAVYTDQALIHMAEHLELPGFRPGKVPKDMVMKKLGEVAVLEEAVELFMRDFYPVLLDTQKIDAVGRPDIRITKLAPGNPVALTIRVTLYPEITLPKDWKESGKNIPVEPAAEATEEEVKQTLESLQKNRMPKKEDGTPILDEVPELTDEFAKSVGAFENLQALKDQIKKGIGEEKARQARDQRRGKIIDVLLEKTTLAVPRIFIESEQDKIMNQMKEDVARFGMTFEDYLKQSGKTEDAIRNEFREQATKRAKLQLTLNKIAQEEKIEADKEAVEGEMKHAFEHFPDANPELVKVHIETVLQNEKILQMLEGNKEPKNEPEAHNHEH